MRILKVSTQKNDIASLKNKFFVFDTETTKLEPMSKNFVFGVIYGFNFHKVIYSVEDFKKEFQHKRYKGKTVFAHNAEFDLLTVFGNIFTEVDTTAIFNGKFISAKYLGITFADSMNIYPTSAEKIGLMINLPKLINKKISGEGLTKENLEPADITYCIRDCKIIFDALLRIFELTVAIKITLPSLAMYDFRNKYLKEDILFSELVDEFYLSYYGGRTEAFKIGTVNANVFDVNSLYPYAMRNCIFPDIKHLKKESKVDVKFLLFALKYYEGMAKVTVKHKEMFFGCLPVRMKVNKSEKLLFPVGEFETYINFNELRYCINEGFVEVLKVDFVVYANPIKSPFVNFVDDNYKKRMSSKDELNKAIYKLKLNSLYGRFGMRMKMTTEYFENIPFDIIRELKEADKFCDIKLFSEQRNDCFIITENEKFKNSFFSIPTFSSYITSEARIILLKSLLQNEAEKVVYCDTDSIFLEGKFKGNVSEGLGDFKKEDKKVIEINGLKNYKYEDKEGKQILVIKGISKNAKKEVDRQTGIESYKIEKYYKTKQALRQNKEAGQSYEMIKTLRQLYDKRLVNHLGETRPIILPLKEIKVVDKTYREPESFYEAVLHYFVAGGKVKKQDVIDNITGKSKEIDLYKNITANNGRSMDSFNDIVNEFLAVEIPSVEVINVLTKFYKISDMKKELMKFYNFDDNITKFGVFIDNEIPF